MPTRHLAVTESVTNVCIVTLLCVVDVTVVLGCQRGRCQSAQNSCCKSGDVSCTLNFEAAHKTSKIGTTLGRAVRGRGAVLLLVLLKCREDRLLTVNLPECSDVELDMNTEPSALSTKPGLR